MGKLKSKRILRDEPTFEDVRKWYDENLHPDKLDIEDEEVYKHVYDEGRFAACFQFTSSGAQKLIQKFKPRSIIDIATCTSIYRPGPLNANVDKIYLKNKENVEEVKNSMHPLVWECLSETFGTIVFQEQIQLLAHKVGGFDLDDTDKVRKALMKRSMKEKDKAAQAVIDLGVRFIEGTMKNGLTETEAKKIWHDIGFFSGYGFNKSLYHLQRVNIIRNDKKLEVQIEDVDKGDYVRSRDEKTKKNIYVKVVQKHDHGVQPIVEVEFETGEKVKCTLNHKFRISDGRMIPVWLILKNDLDVVIENPKKFENASAINNCGKK